MQSARGKLIVLLIVFTLTRLQVVGQEKAELRIDPLMFVLVKECRSISKEIGNKLFPGWNFAKIPILIYRPNVQEVLINYPHQPKGFKEFTNNHLLGKEKIYYRNDTTYFDIDGQNTAFDIEGLRVLVVADRSSNLRNELKDVAFNRSDEFVQRYYQRWGFLPSAYDEISLILHESFHVFQHEKSPEKFANEAALIKYPILDPVNNALYVLEGKVLRAALLEKDPSTRTERAKQFVAVRSYRQSLLDSALVLYENLNEYAEGLAKYIEFAFAKNGANLVPGQEMSYYAHFNGYGNTLTTILEERINRMVDFVSVNTDAFENKFGTGPLRLKLYYLGACQGILLDEVMPSWKERIFKDKVYLSDLLKQAFKLSPKQMRQYLESAQSDNDYDKVYTEKLQFQKEGEAYAQQKADKILKTPKPLVRISYDNYVEKAFLYRFTPFGITKVNHQVSVYDLVPVLIGFKDGVELDMKSPNAILIDKEKKQILFSTDLPTSEIKLIDGNKFDNKDFLLSGANMEVKISGNIVDIKFR